MRELRAWSHDRVWELALRPIDRAQSKFRATLRTFARWLAYDVGNSPPTVGLHLWFIARFLDSVAAVGELQTSLRSLTASHIEDFLVRDARGRKAGAQGPMRSALRRFLAFAGASHLIDPGLMSAVPAIRQYRLAHVPCGIAPDDIRRLLDTIPNDTAAGRRDRAILLLLATYGVRSGHVCALRLEDLEWTARRIRFRAQKGEKEVLHELTAKVGEALARYLKTDRPTSPAREVFLRIRRPHHPLCISALGMIVRGRMMAAEITSQPRGPRAFRHAFATRLLAAGHSLKAIADLLGHRHLGTTAIYAKVNHRSLAEVAAPWPEVLR